jgi:hypothetical protein
MKRPKRRRPPGQTPHDRSAHLWEANLSGLLHRYLAVPITKLDCAILAIAHLLSIRDGVDYLSQLFQLQLQRRVQ